MALIQSVARVLFFLRRPLEKRAFFLSCTALLLVHLLLQTTLFTPPDVQPLSLSGILIRPPVAELVLPGYYPNEAIPLPAIVDIIFVWSIIALLVRRLHTIGRHPSHVIWFFIPFAYLPFLAALFFARDKPHNNQESEPDIWTIALLAVLVPCLVTILLVAFSTLLLEDYGMGLFVGTPFVCGLVSASIANAITPVTLVRSYKHSLASLTLVAAVLFGFAWEGAICIIMAAPLAIAAAFVGATIGWALEGFPFRTESRRVISCFCIGALPLLMLGETKLRAPNQVHSVTSSIIVNAPREAVWKNVVSFSDLPPATELIFQLGLAYPQRARIEGHGVGAIRHCEFSTGAFVEPVTTWDEPSVLAFDVVASPAPMKELSYLEDVHPAHLDGYFASESGRFDLIDIGNGKTLLKGTTKYRNQMWPRPYWDLIADYIVGKIHLRVLSHIKGLAEGVI
jgi:hypothetical protein